MPARMLRYYSDITLEYPDEEIRQYLVYIGKAPLRMDDGIRRRHLDYRYTVIDSHRLDCEQFLAQDNPDALIFAILCDFKDYDAREVVTRILERLLVLTGHQCDEYRKYLAMLDVLAVNRDLQSVIKEVEPMLSLRIEQLASYEIGMEKGIAQGREEGWEKGIQYGMERGEKRGEERGVERAQAAMVRRLLSQFEAPQVAEMTGLDVETVRCLNAQR